jgi:hypothetical protein
MDEPCRSGDSRDHLAAKSPRGRGCRRSYKNRLRLTFEPDCVPERVVADRSREPGPDRIGDDIASEVEDILIAPQRAIVKRARPDASTLSAYAIDDRRDSGLQISDRIGKIAVAKLDERVQVIRHQHPAHHFDIVPRRRDFPRGVACDVEARENGLAQQRRRRDQINPVFTGDAAFSQRSVSASSFAIHATSLRATAALIRSSSAASSRHPTP